MDNDKPHTIRIQGMVDMSLHAFVNGERRHIEKDGDVFNIEGTDVSIVAHRD